MLNMITVMNQINGSVQCKTRIKFGRGAQAATFVVEILILIIYSVVNSSMNVRLEILEQLGCFFKLYFLHLIMLFNNRKILFLHILAGRKNVYWKPAYA